MNNFMDSLQQENNKTLTENGAIAFNSTGDKLLDLFGTIGALRNRKANEINDKFLQAFNEDKLLALKMLFYARNIRGGLGERETPRTIYAFLANRYPEIMRKNLSLIPFFGRWDDMYCFVGTPLEKDAFDFMKQQFFIDLQSLHDGNDNISLLGKWLKSAEHVSYSSCKLGKLTAKYFGLSLQLYRKALSLLRSKLKVLETNMSKQEWDKIQYDIIPALAMKKYHNALELHCPERFSEYMSDVKKGITQMKASTLYPYNILEDCRLTENYESDYYYLSNWNEVAEEQWKALPNYVEGDNNILVMADTSGSMYGRPVTSALGLAIYFAERNKGFFKNRFLTFSEEPSFVHLVGETLEDKVACIKDICQNTNIEAAFDLVLNTAIDYNLSQSELPKAIIIISDMEFDMATRSTGWYYTNKYNTKEKAVEEHNTLMQKIQKRYTDAGYMLPKIIYWNVESRHDTYHANSEWDNVALVSGHAVSSFKTVLQSINDDPIQIMLKALNDPMYDVVQI